MNSSSEKPVYCLEHCKGKKIFSFIIPNKCSHCGEDLTNCELRMPPFRVPSPFVDARYSPCSVVLKPTKGDFLKDYKKSDNLLHLGVVSSNGTVYEFDVDGLRYDRSCTWTQCLSIKDFHSSSTEFDRNSWSQFWDFTLNVVAEQDNWKKIRYNEDRNNCFSFVLAFVRALQSPELSHLQNRRQFCEKYILPKTVFAAKYIALYRKLMMSQS